VATLNSHSVHFIHGVSKLKFSCEWQAIQYC